MYRPAKPVFVAIENYWSPDRITIYRLDNGKYIAERQDRLGKRRYSSELSLAEAFERAKRYAQFNKTPFKWNCINFAYDGSSRPIEWYLYLTSTTLQCKG